MKENDVRIAVVGCGDWGRNLVRCIDDIDALSAVCDSNLAVAEPLGEQFGVPAVAFYDVLEDQSVDALAIAAPAALHYSLAHQALSAGKHVFLEKPIALSVGEGEALRVLADNRGLTLMIGHLLHYHPAYRRLQEMVADDRLGALRYLYSNRLSMGKMRTEEDVVWSFAPHDVSMILGLVGAEPIHVESRGVVAVSDGIIDSAHIHMRFASGIGAHVYASWLHPFKERRLVVVGERACAVFDDTQTWPSKLMITRYRLQHGPFLAAEDVELVAVTPSEPLKNELKHFVHCVRSGERPRTDAKEAMRVLRVLSAASHGLRTEAA